MFDGRPILCYPAKFEQTRFANDERVYKAFLEILNMYRKGRKSITSVYEEARFVGLDNAGPEAVQCGGNFICCASFAERSMAVSYLLGF